MLGHFHNDLEHTCATGKNTGLPLNWIYKFGHFKMNISIILIWLVVSTPLKNISQLGSLFAIYGKKHVPNHQPVIHYLSICNCSTTNLWVIWVVGFSKGIYDEHPDRIGLSINHHEFTTKKVPVSSASTSTWRFPAQSYSWQTLKVWSFSLPVGLPISFNTSSALHHACVPHIWLVVLTILKNISQLFHTMQKCGRLLLMRSRRMRGSES